MQYVTLHILFKYILINHLEHVVLDNISQLKSKYLHWSPFWHLPEMTNHYGGPEGQSSEY